MPQATDEDRQRMVEYFGSWLDDRLPSDFLTKKGWKENNGWWTLPKGETLDTISDKEFHCLKFLIDEWDHDFRR